MGLHQPWCLFYTICTYRRENLFDDPIFCELAENAWRNIPTQPHARHVALDEWVVMPNHLHGILILTDDECRGEAGRTVIPFENGAHFRPASPLPNASVGEAAFDPNDAGQIEIPFTNEIVIPSVSPLPQGVEAGSVGPLSAILNRSSPSGSIISAVRLGAKSGSAVIMIGLYVTSANWLLFAHIFGITRSGGKKTAIIWTLW